jgi:hypothetical protein
MFETFSTRAKRVILLARLEAGNCGATQIDVNHFIIALLIEDQGTIDIGIFGAPPNETGQVLVSSSKGPTEGCCYPTVWVPFVADHEPFFEPSIASGLLSDIRSSFATGEPIPPSSDLPISDDLKKILNRATVLMGNLGHSEVTPLHLLATILERENGSHIQTLRNAGITLVKLLEVLQGAKK